MQVGAGVFIRHSEDSCLSYHFSAAPACDWLEASLALAGAAAPPADISQTIALPKKLTVQLESLLHTQREMAAPVSIEQVAVKLSREEAEFHRETICDLLNRNNKSFPGAQPVSFARHHLAELQHRDYFMCEKTDGVRCLLYLAEMTDERGTVRVAVSHRSQE